MTASQQEGPFFIHGDDVEPRIGTGYPAQFAQICALREKKVLGDQFGLSQFGVNLTTLPPGQASALRHWHQNEDEFVYVISGELVLINDQGEWPMTPGMCAGFPAGVKNGHQLLNRSDAPATYLEIGTRAQTEHAEYPDVDLIAEKTANGFIFTDRQGKPYED